jgi:hypothetical protein
MPYRVQSVCASCGKGDDFVIGDWTRHLGLHVCPRAQSIVNVPVETGQCPGCGEPVPAGDLYDYSFAIPYLGGQTPRTLESGPACPKCAGAPLTFNTHAHINLGTVVHGVERARATWGQDYLEKSIFMNSSIPVMEEFKLDPVQVFDYFNLHLPTGPIATKRFSFPIILDIRTHLWTLRLREPNRFARAGQPAPSGTDDQTLRQLRRRRE